LNYTPKKSNGVAVAKKAVKRACACREFEGGSPQGLNLLIF